MKKNNQFQNPAITLEKFDLNKITSDDPIRKSTITFWMPEDYRLKFCQIQNKSKKEFGKHIQKMIMKLIDSVEADHREQVS